MATSNRPVELPETERILNLIDAVHLKLDHISGGIARGGFGPIAALALGTGINAKKCNAMQAAVPDKTKCYRVSIVSTDKGATVDVSWTDNTGLITNDNGLKGAEQTACRCKMVKVQVHAQNGDAVWMLVECVP